VHWLKITEMTRASSAVKVEKRWRRQSPTDSISSVFTGFLLRAEAGRADVPVLDPVPRIQAIPMPILHLVSFWNYQESDAGIHKFRSAVNRLNKCVVKI
jgi:hypothetical protein